MLLTLSSAVESRLDGAVSGAVGGNGGAGGIPASDFAAARTSAGDGGGGGDGGFGMVLANAGSLRIETAGSVDGGNGGSGGAGGDSTFLSHIHVLPGHGGYGGRGGTGLLALGEAVIDNGGSIQGGSGGTGGAEGVAANGLHVANPGSNGAGGAGVTGSGFTMLNRGRIAGGFSGDGLVRASAVRFTGGSNLLELHAGSELVGAVEVMAGAQARITARADGLSIDDGLVLDGSGTVDTDGHRFLIGALSGAGALIKTGEGTLALPTAITHTGGIALKQGRIDIGHDRALGEGELAMDDGTTLGFEADGLVVANAIRMTGTADPIFDTGAFNGTLTGPITGAADLTKLGTGTLTLAGTNSYSGTTTVAEGTLKAGAANVLAPASPHIVNAGAMLDLAGFNQSVAGLANAGLVSLVGSAPGTTLTVPGPWVGNNGQLRLASRLDGDGSASDRLVLSGPAATASGRTAIEVVNLGGLGALTQGNGIELIAAVDGATTTAQGTRDAFSLANGHVDAGAFSYRLFAADLQGAGESWYLRSSIPLVVPPAPTVPVPPPVAANEEPTPVAAPVAALAPALVPTRVFVPTYRKEVPLFAALPEQMRQGQQMLLANLHQRRGDDAPAGAGAGAGSEGRQAWARVIAADRDIRQSGTVTPRSDGRFEGMQAGTDLWASGGWRAGLYAAHLRGRFDVDGFADGVVGSKVGRTRVRSEALGAYATWASIDGLYVDTVLQAARHRFDLNPLGNMAVQGKANGLLASVEVGRAFALTPSWSIEPQLQLMHGRLNTQDAQLGGTRVRTEAARDWTARLGLRLKGELDTAAGRLQPYARVNVYAGKRGTDRTRYTTGSTATDIHTGTGGRSTEAALGATLALNASTQLYGEVGRTWAGGGDAKTQASVQGSLGVRIAW